LNNILPTNQTNQTMSSLLFQLPPLEEATIIKRPSQYCKTPYMADAILTKDCSEQVMAHAPSLGCCGLADKDANVLLQENPNKKAKSSHSIQLSIHKERHQDQDHETVIGIHPQLAETIVNKCLQQNRIDQLSDLTHYETQKTYNESRFDFYGNDVNNRSFYLEVKTVPLADYVDEPKQRKSKKKQDPQPTNTKGYTEKIAYFPDGYRKNPKDTVSPRALKHVKELQHVVENTLSRGILCFVVQRDDANIFQTSNIDPIYQKAVYEAHEAGVEIMALQVRYTKEGECHFVGQLPVRLQNPETKEEQLVL
jgi:sugar fermentation stimulation protein A